MRALPLVLAAAFLVAGCLQTKTPTPTSPTVPSPLAGGALKLAWLAPVDLKAIGYEPSLVADSKGALFITAHKDLQRPDT
ncbi:MAG: hypothetical protein ACYDCK_00245 [Thermoplasmatota archaeon]